MIRTVLAVASISLGLFVVCVAALGLFRFRYVLNRMHAAAMVDTLGLLLILLGLVLLCGLSVLSVKLVLILLFVWLTSPVTSHLIANVELLTASDIDADDAHGKGETIL